MNVILFGATGMVGQSALRECLLDDRVERVVAVGRTKVSQSHPKLKSFELPDVTDLKTIEAEIAACDVCFYCLGISSVGVSEETYANITYDMTLAIAAELIRLNPDMVFLYISGNGADSSEKGRSMWARIKGKTENALLGMPFKSAYMIRPGAILPLHGIRSKTKLYQTMYAIMRPFYPLFKQLSIVITTEQLGKAMIELADRGYANRIVENHEIKQISQRRP